MTAGEPIAGPRPNGGLSRLETAPVQDVLEDHAVRRPAGLVARWLRGRLAPAVAAGAGAFLVISALAQLTSAMELALLMAPFGASVLLVLAMPESPLSRPHAVVLGHLLSTAVGLVVSSTLGASPLTYGLGVGLAIVAMQATHTLHPPAAGDPIIVLAAGAGWSFLVTPVLLGSVVLVVAGVAYHRVVTRRAYPA